MRLCAAIIAVFLASPLDAQTVVSIRVDAAANRHPISPNIYGLGYYSKAAPHYATEEQLRDLNVPLNREGGDDKIRYNWELNATNQGKGYYFESIAWPDSTPGRDVDRFIEITKAGGAQPMITIPIIGWVAKVGSHREKLASFSVAKYGAQQKTDPYWPDAGNGVLLTGELITNNDPLDANMPVSGAFQQGWLRHLVSRWGTEAAGGVRYYILDNEHSIWFETHRDVHPIGATMEETLAKMIDMAERIKAVDPGAVVFAPEEFGWAGYLYSGYDIQWGPAHNWSRPDRVAHGGMDYVAWLLDQFRRYEGRTGKRLLDVFTVHYYPSDLGTDEFSNDTSLDMQARRNRSTRSLWDPDYTNTNVSWINRPEKLIPRLRDWVKTYYPGTRIGITEYSWGLEWVDNHINGATTQADILGIFGREGLDFATRFGVPATSTATYNAIKMYRNYDGRKSTFGDTSVSAKGADPDVVATFAAVRSSDKALTIMAINKKASTASATINIANFQSAATAERWQLTAANRRWRGAARIERIADVPINGSVLALALPPQSVTLLVVPPPQPARRRSVGH